MTRGAQRRRSGPGVGVSVGVRVRTSRQGRHAGHVKRHDDVSCASVRLACKPRWTWWPARWRGRMTPAVRLSWTSPGAASCTLARVCESRWGGRGLHFDSLGVGGGVVDRQPGRTCPGVRGRCAWEAHGWRVDVQSFHLPLTPPHPLCTSPTGSRALQDERARVQAELRARRVQQARARAERAARRRGVDLGGDDEEDDAGGDGDGDPEGGTSEGPAPGGARGPGWLLTCEDPATVTQLPAFQAAYRAFDEEGAAPALGPVCDECGEQWPGSDTKLRPRTAGQPTRCKRCTGDRPGQTVSGVRRFSAGNAAMPYLDRAAPGALPMYREQRLPELTQVCAYASERGGVALRVCVCVCVCVCQRV